MPLASARAAASMASTARVPAARQHWSQTRKETMPCHGMNRSLCFLRTHRCALRVLSTAREVYACKLAAACQQRTVWTDLGEHRLDRSRRACSFPLVASREVGAHPCWPLPFPHAEGADAIQQQERRRWRGPKTPTPRQSRPKLPQNMKFASTSSRVSTLPTADHSSRLLPKLGAPFPCLTTNQRGPQGIHRLDILSSNPTA